MRRNILRSRRGLRDLRRNGDRRRRWNRWLFLRRLLRLL
jgi:hypothetical protein